MKAVIFANGLLSDGKEASRRARGAHLVVAADGGSRHCLALGVVPHVVIGDMDSTTAEDLRKLEEKGTSVCRHPVRKDKTDLELALELAAERGAREVLVFGALGMRWDMTLANMMVLTAPSMAGTRLILVDGDTRMTVLRGGSRTILFGRPGDVVSLVPAGSPVGGITLRGFEYPLAGARMEAGSTLGISNALVGERATIEIQEGPLFCIVPRTVEIEEDDSPSFFLWGVPSPSQ